MTLIIDRVQLILEVAELGDGTDFPSMKWSGYDFVRLGGVRNILLLKTLFTLTVAFAAILMASSAHAQNSQRSVVIGTMTTRPNALLVLNPPGSDQGFLLPQLRTRDRVSIRPSSPEEDGLLVFDSDEKEFYVWKGGRWNKGLGGSDQTLSFDPLTLKLTLSDGNTVDLSQLQEVPDQAEQTGKFLTTDGVALTWARPDIVNELPNQTGNVGKFLTTNGTTVSWAAVPGAASPTLQTYSVDPSDFLGAGNDKPDKDNSVMFEDNTTFITTARRDDGSMLIAPIHLPDGAIIQQVVVYYMDRDGQNLAVTLSRKPFMGSNDNITVTFNSSGNSPAIQSQTLTPTPGKEVIDNSLYTYRIIADLNPTGDSNHSTDATHRIYGVQIKYIK